MVASTKARLRGRLVRLADIKTDPEFERLQLPRAPEDIKTLTERLALASAPEPLLVWRKAHALVLLCDYEKFALLRQLGVRRCRVVEKALETHAEACWFIIQQSLQQNYASELGVRYLRGCRVCTRERPARGGDRRSQAFQGGANGDSERPRKSPEKESAAAALGLWKTVEAMAEMCGVSERTIYRDASLYQAVEHIVEVYAERARSLLLRRGAKVSFESVLFVSKLEDAEIRKHLFALEVMNVRLPSSELGPREETLTVPRELKAMAKSLLKQLGPEEFFIELELMKDLWAEYQAQHARRGQDNERK